ncbi:MAG TPA: type IV toxin-antitoxin system AbiEi family antitoxin domain-containing protein, partial [Gemmatimonadaceae bacterium]|nr:type IV toxin-antitoxin system AbiEi family antitoxin domain-containing protein [Gemmatimonadaceae bacterium]
EVLRSQGLARTSELERGGVSRTQLARLVQRGEIERVGRGLYRLPGAGYDERQSLAEAARRVPAGVVCLLSALRFHGLTTQNPFEVWMAVPHKAWRPTFGYPPLRLVFLSPPMFEADVEKHRAGGTSIQVFSAPRTVVDCFKFRNKLGTDVAVQALREYHRKHPKRLAALERVAGFGRVDRVMRPYLESLE